MPSCIDTETPERANTLIMGAWNLGYHGAAVAAAIAYDTGLSPVDVRTLTVGDLQGNKIIRDHTKTGRTFDLKLRPKTSKYLDIRLHFALPSQQKFSREERRRSKG